MKNSHQPQPHIADLHPYKPGMTIDSLAERYGLHPEKIIKLASNENPHGMSPRVAAEITASLGRAERYPDGRRLQQALAKHTGLSEQNVILGNGSNDVLDLVARTFLGAGTEAISSQYAFGVFGLLTQAAGARNVVISARTYSHDLEAMAAAITPRTRVIWVANPNNPTGTFIPADEVQDFLRSIPKNIIVVLDEAYREYLADADQTDAAAWLAQFPNLIIVRTFSKAYGLAGFRVGYGLASSHIISLLHRVRQPFNVSGPSLHAALVALEDRGFIADSYRRNQAGLAQLARGLSELALPHLPTFGNFVTVQFPGAASTHQALLEQGIIVRPLLEYGLPHHLRISVGLPGENERLIAALNTILNGEKS